MRVRARVCVLAFRTEEQGVCCSPLTSFSCCFPACPCAASWRVRPRGYRPHDSSLVQQDKTFQSCDCIASDFFFSFFSFCWFFLVFFNNNGAAANFVPLRHFSVCVFCPFPANCNFCFPLQRVSKDRRRRPQSISSFAHKDADRSHSFFLL